MMNQEPLSARFSQYFRVVLAHTPELLEQVYKVRFDVYCKEFRFEQEENCPGEIEKDEYDQHSLHCLVIHKKSNIPAGCVRLIKVSENCPSLLLPLEKFCGHSLSHDSFHPKRFPRSSLGEISRLAVHPTFRRRRGEDQSPIGYKFTELSEQPTESELRSFPLISVALIAASTSLLILSQRNNLFVMVENWLAVLLRRLGLKFTQIGETIDYHGERAAYFITVDQMLQGMKGDLRELYGYVYGSLEANAAYMPLDLT